MSIIDDEKQEVRSGEWKVYVPLTWIIKFLWDKILRVFK